jgi:hypothetical protein|tara:strand:+ start:109 stop:303 length:195 start_codon:yes stop_codon:yes gene_type:complete
MPKEDPWLKNYITEQIIHLIQELEKQISVGKTISSAGRQIGLTELIYFARGRNTEVKTPTRLSD